MVSGGAIRMTCSLVAFTSTPAAIKASLTERAEQPAASSIPINRPMPRTAVI
jgi:hypothetical protein